MAIAELAKVEVIDAHQHFWELGRFDYGWLEGEGLAPIRRNFLPPDLQPHLAAAGVGRAIVVQTQHNLEETRWFLSLATRYDFLAGVVGWVDLRSEQCESQLVELMQHPKLVGIRHVTQDEPDDDFVVREDVLRGLRILQKHAVPFDLLFYVKHLRHAATLARQFPDLPLVLDHLAKPHIKDARMDDWLPDFRAAAAFPYVYCKLSGLITEADWRHWRPADLQPYVQEALELFGPQRLMFGSDWPVCELAGTYEQVFAATLDAIGPLSQTERRDIFGGTAQRFYGLSPAK